MSAHRVLCASEPFGNIGAADSFVDNQAIDLLLTRGEGDKSGPHLVTTDPEIESVPENTTCGVVGDAVPMVIFPVPVASKVSTPAVSVSTPPPGVPAPVTE